MRLVKATKAFPLAKFYNLSTGYTVSFHVSLSFFNTMSVLYDERHLVKDPLP